MARPTRRNLIKIAGMSPLLSMGSPAKLWAGRQPQNKDLFLGDIKPNIQFIYDGIRLSPHQYAQLLVNLTANPDFRSDNEGHGGVVKQLEERFADITGKSKAIYLPSGTMANQLAVRVLAEGTSKVFAQETSHFYRDEGDAAQELHQKRIVPLAPGKATFTHQQLLDRIADIRRSEVFPTEIGAISIENPVRRCSEEIFNIEELRKISQFARDNSIGMHLDGARLHMALAYSGITLKEMAELFDTVYISLYKYLGASAGAILCGSERVINRIPHLIKICGGNMAANWNTTAVALHFLEGFQERYAQAITTSRALFAELNRGGTMRVEPFSNGSNNVKLFLKHGNYDVFRKYLADNAQVYLRSSRGDHLLLKVNESITFSSPAYLLNAFHRAYQHSA